MVSKDEFVAWRQSDVTQRVWEVLGQEREQLKEGLVYANFEHPDEVRGMCKAIANFQNITYEDLYGNSSE